MRRSLLLLTFFTNAVVDAAPARWPSSSKTDTVLRSLLSVSRPLEGRLISTTIISRTDTYLSEGWHNKHDDDDDDGGGKDHDEVKIDELDNAQLVDAMTERKGDDDGTEKEEEHHRNDDDNHSDDSGGLSGSTIAGAVVGSFLSLLILLFIWYFLVIRPKRKDRLRESNLPKGDDTQSHSTVSQTELRPVHNHAPHETSHRVEDRPQTRSALASPSIPSTTPAQSTATPVTPALSPVMTGRSYATLAHPSAPPAHLYPTYTEDTAASAQPPYDILPTYMDVVANSPQPRSPIRETPSEVEIVSPIEQLGQTYAPPEYDMPMPPSSAAFSTWKQPISRY